MLMLSTRFPLGGREGGSKTGPRSEPWLSEAEAGKALENHADASHPAGPVA